MTNNQLCNLLGGTGCFVLFFSMVLMFFGTGGAVWGVVAGICLALVSLVSYN